jgi:hypothetical protein
MTLWPTLGNLVASVSGLFFVALGLAVAWVRPRRRPQVWFAGFAISFGVAQFFINFASVDEPLRVFTDPLMDLGFAAAIVPLVVLGARVPAQPPMSAAAYAAGALAAVGAAAWVVIWWSQGATPRDPTTPWAGLLMLAFGGVLLFLPLRFRGARAGSRERTQLALMAAALVFWPAAIASANVRSANPVWVAHAMLHLPMFVAAAALWLAATHTVDRRDRRLARDVALVTLGVLTASFAVRPLLGPATGGGPGLLYGSARLLTVLLLAYAILRQQLFGLDIKVKWTLKQSTVAAVFIGVFFVVSESASTFFAASGLGPYMGIAAAGLLVFAMAPLQRAAERVASAAMPGVKGPAEMSRDERLGFYREHLRLAYADGVVDRGERSLLLHARERLGLSTEDAERAERELLQGEGSA